MCAHTHTHAHACTHIRKHMHTYTHTHTRMHARTYAHTHTHTHTRTHICTHAHAHTHTNHFSLPSALLCRYMLSQVKLAVEGEDCILQSVTIPAADGQLQTLYTLRPGVTFHFFSSQAPCERFIILLIPLFSRSFIFESFASDLLMLKYYHAN